MLLLHCYDRKFPVSPVRHNINPKKHWKVQRIFIWLIINFMQTLFNKYNHQEFQCNNLPPPWMEKSWGLAKCYILFPSNLNSKSNMLKALDKFFVLICYFAHQNYSKTLVVLSGVFSIIRVQLTLITYIYLV